MIQLSMISFNKNDKLKFTSNLLMNSYCINYIEIKR